MFHHLLSTRELFFFAIFRDFDACPNYMEVGPSEHFGPTPNLRPSVFVGRRNDIPAYIQGPARSCHCHCSWDGQRRAKF